MAKRRALAAGVLLACAALAHAQAPGPHATLSAEVARSWTDGERYILLQRDAYFLQGETRVRADEILVLAPANAPPEGDHVRLRLFARGNVRVERPGAPSDESDVLKQEFLALGYHVSATEQRENSPAPDHSLVVQVRRATADAGDAGVVRADLVAPQATDNDGGKIRPAQFAAPAAPLPGQAGRGNRTGAGIGPKLAPSKDPNARRVLSLAPRGSRGFSVTFNQQTPQNERMDTIGGGVVVTIEEPDTGNLATLAADRAVIWRRPKDDATAPPAPALVGGTDVSNDAVRVYLEGNVQVNIGNLRNLGRGNQVQFNARQAFYDAELNRAMALDGYVETYDDRLRAPLLMRADRFFMFSNEKFFGEGAMFTTSAHRGLPGYEFDAKEGYLALGERPIVNPFTGEQLLDEKGTPLKRQRNLATGYNDVLRLDGVPVFWSPYLKLDLDHPLGAVEAIKLGNVGNMGFVANLTLDMWYLLGLDYLPFAQRSRWQGDLGYYSLRGLAGGTRLEYTGAEPAGQPGSYQGRFLTWWIHDNGLDNLGLDRNGLTPDTAHRGRAFFQHRQEFQEGVTLLAGFSHLSDKNFLQSFFQNDFDVGPDQETYLYLKQQQKSWAWSVLAQPRNVNFLPQTESLPRGDLWLLGQSLWGDRLSYFTHTSAGYFRVGPPAGVPILGLPSLDAAANTGRVDTRHELDLPLRVGDLNVVPYALGEFTGYSRDINGAAVARFLGGGGVRASLPFWRTFPGVESELFNLHGLAHKVNLTADFWWGQTNVPRTNLPYIDQADDDTSDLVRRMNLYRTYTANGLPIPVRYDPRFETFRRNLEATPDTLDSLSVLQLGVEQRWQTKRGPEDAAKIVDWMTLNTHASWFPQSTRDNFGKPWGLIDYDYKWHLGDRTSIISTGSWEPLDGTQTATVAAMVQRPPRQSLTLFASHYVSGPFLSNFIGGTTSYRFSEKYAAYLGTAVDLSQFNKVSWQAGVTRVGLDFITTTSVAFNASARTFGFQFDILPKIAPASSRTHNMAQTLPFGVDSDDRIAPIQPGVIGGLPQYGGTPPF